MISNTGVFPDKWIEDIIVPLYKKGSTKDVNNYRGITLVSHVAKLFTTIVNNRLTEWCNKYNVVSDAQFGFKKVVSIVDEIFSLQCIMTKCFDSLYRNALWPKRYKLCVNSRLLLINRAMYETVRCKVKNAVTRFQTSWKYQLD